MNIAIIIHALGGGGAERASQILGNYFVSVGNRVYYFLQDTGIKQDYPVQGEVIRTNIKSCMSKDMNDIQRFLWLLRSSIQMRRLKRQYKIDAAISFMEESNYINVLSKGREKVITRVCTILSQRKDLVGFLYNKRMVRFFYSKADQVVVMSHYALKDMACCYGVPKKKLTKIPNAVADGNMDQTESEWEYGTKALVCMGRLEAVKQQDRIIRAFSYAAGKEEQARLIFLGRGSGLDYLKQLCVKYKIEDKVEFIGFTKRTSYYLRHARALVIASRVEGFPNSILEAMNCGTPVITADSPGACGEIVGKSGTIGEVKSMVLCKYGILVPVMPDTKLNPDSPLVEQEEVLGEAMLKVLTEDKVYEEYRKRSLRRAGMYSVDRVGKKWECMLKQKLDAS